MSGEPHRAGLARRRRRPEWSARESAPIRPRQLCGRDRRSPSSSQAPRKSGTTALHRFLSTHPELFLPAKKDLHFFDSEAAIDWSAPTAPLYETHFAGARPDQICGEAIPVHLFHEPSLQRIRTYNPRMRLILPLRDPVERAHSHWRMEVARGDEPLSFSEAIREGRARVARYWRVFSYVERGVYGTQLKRLETCFPREQILGLLTGEMKRDHAGTLLPVPR
ncbi:sulfotransferase domain-containing protein [Rhodobacter sp. NSM]|uniref:sulfotransferase domain-containing protein n=1 Tax=Rhodobacter sp. NSM TaxID=3457501 RepID=UPI003FD51281